VNNSSNGRAGPWSVVIPPKTVFVGHRIPDTDAICSAIAAAELFDGIPARAGALNTETEYVMKKFNLPLPVLFKDLPSEVGHIALVDHQQMSQVAEGVDLSKVIAIIDHHAFQNGTISTRVPIYADVRPWGSASTIIAHAYIQHKHPLSKTSAAALLCGIISDTLSLCSPTTTHYDRMMVTFLSYAANIADVEELAKEMFQAKSRELKNMNTYSLVRGDIKKFDTAHVAENTSLRIAIGVVECTDPAIVMKRRKDVVEELQALKLEDNVDLAYLIVVDIVQLFSEVISPDADEFDLACQAFEGGTVTKHKTIQLQKGRVSRKLDFMPSLVRVLEKGWEKKTVVTKSARALQRKNLPSVVYVDGPTGTQLERVRSNISISS